MPTLSVLLIDDFPVLRAGLRQVIEAVSDQIEVSMAGSLEEAFAQVATRRVPDLALLDLNLPDGAGLATLSAFRRRAPGVRVVVLVDHAGTLTAQDCTSAGAVGVLYKTAQLSELIAAASRLVAMVAKECVGIAATGKPVPSGPVPESAPPLRTGANTWRPPDILSFGFTSRQCQVLRLLIQGVPNKRICREIGIRHGTVKTHVSNVLHALGVENRAQVAVAASRRGIRIEDLVWPE